MCCGVVPLVFLASRSSIDPVALSPVRMYYVSPHSTFIRGGMRKHAIIIMCACPRAYAPVCYVSCPFFCNLVRGHSRVRSSCTINQRAIRIIIMRSCAKGGCAEELRPYRRIKNTWYLVPGHIHIYYLLLFYCSRIRAEELRTYRKIGRCNGLLSCCPYV